jgi:hypothetical protein
MRRDHARPIAAGLEFRCLRFSKHCDTLPHHDALANRATQM